MYTSKLTAMFNLEMLLGSFIPSDHDQGPCLQAEPGARTGVCLYEVRPQEQLLAGH
jgi:hypothetical protein